MTDAASGPTGVATDQRRDPLWYAQEAVRIARIDTEAIGRVARDHMALLYGLASGLLPIAGDKVITREIPALASGGAAVSASPVAAPPGSTSSGG